MYDVLSCYSYLSIIKNRSTNMVILALRLLLLGSYDICHMFAIAVVHKNRPYVAGTNTQNPRFLLASVI
jgi:hypothetical protein